jgi:methylated-DNA-[protein]-cysteine S-methyltransferase
MKTVIFDSTITIDSPIGPITLKSLGNAVVKVNLHGFEGPGAGHGSGHAALNAANPTADATAPSADATAPSSVLTEASKQLSEFFAGERTTLDFAVEPAGTEFQRAVWSEIGKVGFGEVISYADIARRIGNPNAVRAVGGAVGSNPVPLVIGCHRILGAASTITGYSGGDGLPTKRWLLAHENISYRDVPANRRDAETPLTIE